MVEVFNIGMECTIALVISVLLFANQMKARKSESEQIFISVVMLILVLYLCDMMECSSIVLSLHPGLTLVTWLLDYGLTVVIMCSFHRYLTAFLTEKGAPQISRTLHVFYYVWAILAYSAFVASCWSGTYFTIGAGGIFQYTDRIWIADMSFWFLALIDLGIILYHRRTMGEKYTGIFLVYILLPTVGVIADMRYDTVFCYIGMGIAVLIGYINLSIDWDRELLEKERMLTESRLNAVHLHMNPHFIYNALASISSLCYKDPGQATRYISLFSSYLRGSFGEQGDRSMVYFWEELERLELYLCLEKLRFPDMIVITDIEVEDFEIPNMTVQPLVENAIQHGIGGRKHGGTLLISSYETEKAYYVRIEDDGVGYEEIPKDGRQHRGIRNVRMRLEMLCNGRLTIRSTPGKGTIAEICIRKEKKG